MWSKTNNMFLKIPWVVLCKRKRDCYLLIVYYILFIINLCMLSHLILTTTNEIHLIIFILHLGKLRPRESKQQGELLNADLFASECQAFPCVSTVTTHSFRIAPAVPVESSVQTTKSQPLLFGERNTHLSHSQTWRVSLWFEVTFAFS